MTNKQQIKEANVLDVPAYKRPKLTLQQMKDALKKDKMGNDKISHSDNLAKARNEEFELAESVNLDEGTVQHGNYTIKTGTAFKGTSEGEPSHITGHIGRMKSLEVPHERGEKYGKTVRVTVTNNKTGDSTHHHVYQRDFQSTAKPVVSVRSAGAENEKHNEHAQVLKLYLTGKKSPVSEGLEEMSKAQMNKREDIVKGMKKSFADFRKRYGEKAKEVMYATATKQAMKEDEDTGMHYCAKHVRSSMLGDGVVLEAQHAEPDELGNIEWYMVEFKDGVHKVFTEQLEIMLAEYHGNHKKKKRMTNG